MRKQRRLYGIHSGSRAGGRAKFAYRVGTKNTSPGNLPSFGLDHTLGGNLVWSKNTKAAIVKAERGKRDKDIYDVSGAIAHSKNMTKRSRIGVSNNTVVTKLKVANRDKKPIIKTKMIQAQKVKTAIKIKSPTETTNARAQSLTKKVLAEFAKKQTTGQNGFSVTENLTDYTTSKGSPASPASSVHDTRHMRMANFTEARGIHRTKYNTGFGPSRPVRDLIKSVGTGYRVLCDSKIQFKSEDERNSLTNLAGFNSRNFHVPCEFAQMTLGKVWNLCEYPNEIGTEGTDGTRTTERIAALLSVKNQYLIHNTSLGFPIKFKIHLVKIETDACDVPYSWLDTIAKAIPSEEEMLALNDVAFPGTAYEDFWTLSTATQQKVPWIYMHSGWEESGASDDNKGISRSWNMSLKGKGLAESSYFKNNVKVIETFEKTIPPGDFWNFSHTHSCGGGVNIDDIIEATSNGQEENVMSLPFTLGVIFETKGTLCEGVKQNLGGTKDTYMGTSPAPYTYEFKSSAYYVRERDPFLNLTDPGSLPAQDRIYRRTYTSNPTVLNSLVTTTPEFWGSKEIFGLPDKIKDTNVIAVDEWYVPFASASSVRSNTRTAGSNG